MSFTFEKWQLDVPDDFQFTIKLWKQITHIKELRFNSSDVDLFLQRAENIGHKKGCLLLQFPGKITLDYYSMVEEILRLIVNAVSSVGWKIAVEFRNPSWYTGETVELLDEYNASMVGHDFPKAKNEKIYSRSNCVYLRFHGPNGDYRGGYSNDFLHDKAHQIKEWTTQGKDVYAYFNNTVGDAFENALTLQRLCR